MTQGVSTVYLIIIISVETNLYAHLVERTREIKTSALVKIYAADVI